MSIKNEVDEIKALELSTLVTCLGDFISKFAFIKILLGQGESIFIVSGIVPLQQTGVLLAPFINQLFSKFSTKKLLFLTQVISAVLSFGILALYLMQNLSVLAFSISIVFLSILSNIFNTTREIHSKHLFDEKTNISTQSKLLSGFYRAQFLGPVFSMILIVIFPLWIPLLLDSISFVVSSLLISNARLSLFFNGKVNPLRPLLYLPKNKSMIIIFLLRSLGFWIGAGLFNYIVFSIINLRFNIDPINSAWVYSSVGLGATIAATYLRSKISSSFKTEATVSFFGHIGIAICSLGFYFVKSFYLALSIMVIYGVFMGLNAIGSQSLRRRIIGADHFSDIVWLEGFVSKFTEILISVLAMLVLLKINSNIEVWLFISAVSTVVVGCLYLIFFIRK